MIAQPAYFETVRKKAVNRWDQLEQDPELAGPWHQLFKQVQSPRHILSELLQNADDAGASEASVRIQDHEFIFEHNGEDFAPEHFASLCGFGYSNKRSLHTIGFRGIGFKSTFSLGERVELFTPSLAVSFHRRRFTEPQWVSDNIGTHGRTRIRVKINDQKREREVEKNLEEWLKSPLSLLFFKNIRRIQIGDREAHWGSLGPGPISGSEWMALYDKQDESFLHIRSNEEPFPEDALAEIRQERMVAIDDGADFPPCSIEIVLGAKGRLYVVLPTGVETELPFALNAPFIQDPARMKIKDPEISPTNRWLLGRAGRLAAEAMLGWLEKSETSVEERARAYALLPDVDREGSSLEDVCGTAVEEAFSETVDGAALLLTDDGKLVAEKECTAIPRPVFDIWSSNQVATLFDEKNRPPLCSHVERDARQKLTRWGFVEELSKQQFLDILRGKHLPKPESWRQLMSLWAYIAPDIAGYQYFTKPQDLRIVPVQGRDVLYAASETVRLGEKKLLQSEEDWEFLAAHLIVLNQNWTRFLAEERRRASEKGDRSAQETAERGYAVLKKIGLEDTSDANKLIEQVAGQFFSQKEVPLTGCVRLAQIAAKLGANVGDAFCYATRDKNLRATSKGVFFDEDGKLEELLPEQQRESLLIHSDYFTSFGSCSREDWLKWIASGRAGVLTFVPLKQTRRTIYGKRHIQQEAANRSLDAELSYPYVTHDFVIEDWNFDAEYWSIWEKAASHDDTFWLKVGDRILAQRDTFWSPARSARFLQVATTGRTQSLTHEPILPAWCQRLRTLRCLPDTRGFARKPDELFRRTPETESLFDVEPFVHGLLDRETTRPLLDLLGVQSTPTGPDRILNCVRALTKAEKPPVHEVEKWYRRLDQMAATCSTESFQEIRLAFRTEPLVLTQDGSWTTASAVFLSANEDDVPGAAIIRPSVRELTLWQKVGVGERPTADLAIVWLKTLPSNAALPQEDSRRVRALLARHPARIWDECAHWLNLAGEWVPTTALSYALTMQSLIAWSHLHQWVKQKTADLRLPVEVTSNPPFCHVPVLAQHVEERLDRDLLSHGMPENHEWLSVIATELTRVEFDRDEETTRVRALATTLANTKWHTMEGLEIIPYIDGTPAGTSRKADILWLDRSLYVERLPKAKVARRVPEEVGRAFGREDIKAALAYSFERSPEDIRSYLEENFSLGAIVDVPPTASGDASAPSGTAENKGSMPEVADPPITHVTVEAEPLAPADDNGGAPGEINDHDATDQRPRPAPRAAKPSLIERFALAHGFRKDGDERFFHEDGSWIGRVPESSFPWERRNRTGELLRSYLPVAGCLKRQPLEVEADVWSLLEKRPDIYSLITTDVDDRPIEMTGAELTQLRQSGQINVFPATYRLVHDSIN